MGNRLEVPLGGSKSMDPMSRPGFGLSKAIKLLLVGLLIAFGSGLVGCGGGGGSGGGLR